MREIVVAQLFLYKNLYCTRIDTISYTLVTQGKVLNRLGYSPTNLPPETPGV